MTYRSESSVTRVNIIKMGSVSDQDKLGFQGRVNWDDYIKYRPSYPQSFYDRIYAHHEKYSSSFGVVNDCGAGGGVASRVLAKKFDKVIVSEPNEKYLAFAKNQLLELFPKGKFQFLNETGEKSSIPSESLDALTICEALHWCNIPVAMREFHRQLKKGGTLCIGHYTIPCTNEPEFGKLWDELWIGAMGKFHHDGGNGSLAGKNMSMGYESIPFPEELWEPGVERIMINAKGDIMNVATKGIEDEVRLPSALGKNDKQIWIEDDKEWMREADLEWFKRVYYAMIPWEKEENDDAIWEKLERAIGGKEKKVLAYHVVTQLIATKR